MNNLEQQVLALQAEVARLRAAADRDDLTGCLRRQAFLSMIEEQRRFGLLPQSMTLAVVDIDHFKKVNDNHGHLAGDDALRSVAAILRSQAPEGSLVCRMGGEEFVILMPGTSEANQGAMEQIRRAIERSPVEVSGNVRLRITASFGAADWNTDHPMLEATARADGAMYASKRNGRNRVTLDSQAQRLAS